MPEQPNPGFASLKVVAFESRKAKEMAALITNQHGIPLIAPAMREIPLEENPAAFAFADELFGGRVDALIFMTGIGTRTLCEVLETRYSRTRMVSALSSILVVARGPKPAAVLREFGIPVRVAVPEPNTWREVLETLDRGPGGFTFAGTRIVVQEYGKPKAEFLDGLRSRGAELISVPVYRWGLPVELEPLRAALRAIVEGEAQIVLFTTAFQVESVLPIAAEERCEQRLLDALTQCVICSIGPTCSEALTGRGIQVDIEPEHPKMGFLVHEAAQRAAGLLRDKSGVVV